ncbi:hypothetical protein [Tahibacter caeni]|uniref:hypothetical protein n=1 Tax=Tahibacter caeni TaxID=1453545 RepID=UPI0021471FE0|nr:hypothetical protein [Tahibacter caeni]
MTTADLVNADALVKRVNRAPAMRRDGRRVKACAERSRERSELGAYYITDARGVVTDRNVDLPRIARELGVLKPDDVQVSPLAMTLDQAEALLYAARERLQDVAGTAHERALRQDVEEAQTRVNLLRAAQARGPQ